MDERNVVHVMHDMEELRLRLDYGVKALSAVVEGMRHGDYGVSDYADSVYGVYDHLSGINDRMAGGTGSVL